MLWRSARASSRSFVTSSTSRCRLRIVARSRGTQNEAKTPYPWLSSVNVLCCSTTPSSSFSSASPRGSFSLPLILPPPSSRRDTACPATLLKAREHVKGQVGPARKCVPGLRHGRRKWSSSALPGQVVQQCTRVVALVPHLTKVSLQLPDGGKEARHAK